MTLLWCVNEGRRSSAGCLKAGHRVELRAIDPNKDSGWQAAIEADEARLSTSAQARRRVHELAEVRTDAAQAFRAVEELSAKLAAAVVELANVRAAAERNVARLAHARSELQFARHDAEHCAAERDQALAEVKRLRAQLDEGGER